MIIGITKKDRKLKSKPRMTWIRASYLGWARKMTMLLMDADAASRVYAQITSLLGTSDPAGA
jgi:hypothetical protein